MALPVIDIDTGGPVGVGTITTMDGNIVHGLTGINVHIGMEEPNKVVLHLMAAVHIRTEAIPQYVAVVADPTDGEILMGEGDDLVGTLNSLLASAKVKGHHARTRDGG